MIKRFLYTFLIFFFTIVTPVFAIDFKISDVKIDNSEKLILLKGNISASDVKYSAGFLQNPTRAYIDLSDSILLENKKTIEFQSGPIKKIMMAQFETRPNKVRLVFYADNLEDLKKIKLIKNRRSLAFKLQDFEYGDLRIPIIFSDMLPKEYEEVKSLPIEKAKYSSYILTNVTKTDAGLLLSGIGNVKLSRPFILLDPIRIVFDLQNAVVQKKEFCDEIVLPNDDKVKIGQFNANTLRFVVTTENPNLYKAFISPDMQSIYLTNVEQHIGHGVLPDMNRNTSIRKLEISQPTANETFITIDFDMPIIHSLKKTYNKFVIDLLNVSYEKYKNIATTKKTKQFEGFIVQQAADNLNSLSLMFEVNDDLKVETGMTQDGKKIAIKLTDVSQTENVSEVKPDEIKSDEIKSDENQGEQKVVPKKEKKKLQLKNKVIVVDAGHGGKDPGAGSGKMFEKEPALKMALMLQKHLEDEGAKVIMTRSNDTYVSLKDRVSISNFENADLFVSLHLNSSEKSHINGIETHWYKNDSKLLAEIVQANLVKNVNAGDRGLFNSMFYVINHTKAPAILVETGFISNAQERNELFEKDRQEKTAKAIADGIVEYFKKR